MTKLNALLFRFLPNEAHYGFFEKATRELADAGDDVKAAVGPLAAALNDWFATETANLVWYRKSTLTAGIAAARQRLNGALVGLSAQVNAARYSILPGVAAAAGRLRIMLKNYGSVTRKPYQQEIGASTAILSHLSGDFAADVQTAGVADRVAEIGDALAEFAGLMEQRDARMLDKPQLGFPETRRGIENIWRQIVTRVNAGAELDLSPGFAAFVNAVNPRIDSFNSEFHRVRHNIAAARIADIGLQPYTGYPCTPLPEVWYTTPKGTVKLELGRDFSLTYKHNVNAGNAECTIHGKGAFRGRKTVTFFIAVVSD